MKQIFDPLTIPDVDDLPGPITGPQSSFQEATASVQPFSPFEDPNQPRVFDPQSIPSVNPDNSGVGAAIGGLAGVATELANPLRRAKALQVATSGGKIDKLKEALLSESRISGFSAGGDLVESAIRAGAEGNLPVAGQALKSAATEFGVGLGFGLGARGVVGASNKILFRPALTRPPEVDLAYEVLEEGMNAKGFSALTLAAGTNSTIFDTMDNVARSGIGSASIMANADQATSDVISELLETATKGIAPRQSIRELTNILFEAVTNREAISDLPAIVLRNSLKAEADKAGVTVNIDDLQNFILKNADEVDSIGGFGKTLSGVTQSQALLNILDDPSVGSALVIRSMAQAMVRSMQKNPEKASTPRIGMMKQVATLADQAVKKSLQEADETFNTTMLESLRKSDEGFKQQYDTFYNDVINKIKKSINLNGASNPAGVADGILKQTNSFEFAAAAKEAFPAKEWPLVQRAVIDRIRDQVTDFRTKKLDGAKLSRMFADDAEFGADTARLGTDTLDVIFGKPLRKDLQKMFRALEFAQRKNPVSTGTVITSLAQGGGVAIAASDFLSGEPMSALTLIGVVAGVPWLFAKMNTNPFIVKKLTQGLIDGPTNPAWGAAFPKIMQFISVATQEREREGLPPPPQPTRSRVDPLASQLLSGPAFTP